MLIFYDCGLSCNSIKSLQIVDVQSNQQRCPESILLMRTVQQDCFESFLVDVPRFELGNRNAERIRCFILGFQVAQRLAAWQNTRYGGGL